MGKLTISDPLIIEFRKIGGRMQSLDGTNWTDEMTMYHIIDKYKEYECSQKEQEILKVEENEGIQEAIKPIKARKGKR